jgi:hypothetical protein
MTVSTSSVVISRISRKCSMTSSAIGNGVLIMALVGGGIGMMSHRAHRVRTMTRIDQESLVQALHPSVSQVRSRPLSSI